MVKKLPGWALPDLREAQKRTKNEVEFQTAQFSIPYEILNLGRGKKYYLRTYGCQANERDSETIAGIMEELGYEVTSDVEVADVILLNTCAVRKNAEDKVIGEIGALKRLFKDRPELILGVCGCMSQEEEIVNLLLEKHRHVNLIFGTHNIHRLPELLYKVYHGGKTVEVFSKEGEVIENLPVRRFGKHKAWVNIMYGCDKFCTYCIVPYTRGKERSRRLEDILTEVRILKEEGYKEVTLLGQNVNAYGKDLGMVQGFAELLRETAKIGIPRIRFTTSHPWDFTDEMVDVLGEFENIMPFVHLPVQSGDDAMLKIMGRKYSREQYLRLFHRIEATVPNCAFSTDIIVGFPNETDEQFRQTLSLVEECKFDNCFTFIYSPREGTPAARMVDNVAMEEKQQRLHELNVVWNKHAKHKNEAYIGQVVEVLVDGHSKKNANVYSGYTKTNKLVNFTGENLEAGEFVMVKITDAKTFSLDGEMVKE